MSTVATTTFILLLANNQPLNFIQGTNISLEDVLCQGNRHEFHHIFPKAYLEKNGYKSDEINCLANISMLSRADNNKIKDNPPSEYRSQMPTDDSTLQKILGTHLCSQEMFSDDYHKFISMRADLLTQKAKELSKLT
ncbi:hypothetical protein [Okeania sp. SIO1I7]|uniref:hypothetical protein n=1 Tax=Okeania sp. SIO1I7 TaxID=2607772 RepID=UPI0013FB3F2C|nr:hypothetical protein [Okeania sp. SIO1I7]NET26502.1 hypothetical protein [Okeania sp. SIO1I7]